MNEVQPSCSTHQYFVPFYGQVPYFVIIPCLPTMTPEHMWEFLPENLSLLILYLAAPGCFLLLPVLI